MSGKFQLWHVQTKDVQAEIDQAGDLSIIACDLWLVVGPELDIDIDIDYISVDLGKFRFMLRQASGLQIRKAAGLTSAMVAFTLTCCIEPCGAPVALT